MSKQQTSLLIEVCEDRLVPSSFPLTEVDPYLGNDFAQPVAIHLGSQVAGESRSSWGSIPLTQGFVSSIGQSLPRISPEIQPVDSSPAIQLGNSPLDLSGLHASAPATSPVVVLNQSLPALQSAWDSNESGSWFLFRPSGISIIEDRLTQSVSDRESSPSGLANSYDSLVDVTSWTFSWTWASTAVIALEVPGGDAVIAPVTSTLTENNLLPSALILKDQTELSFSSDPIRQALASLDNATVAPVQPAGLVNENPAVVDDTSPLRSVAPDGQSVSNPPASGVTSPIITPLLPLISTTSPSIASQSLQSSGAAVASAFLIPATESRLATDPNLAVYSVAASASATALPLTATLGNITTVTQEIPILARSTERIVLHSPVQKGQALVGPDSEEREANSMTLEVQQPTGKPMEGSVRLNETQFDSEVSQFLSDMTDLGDGLSDGLGHSHFYSWSVLVGVLGASAAYVLYTNRHSQYPPRLVLTRRLLAHWQGEENDNG